MKTNKFIVLQECLYEFKFFGLLTDFSVLTMFLSIIDLSVKACEELSDIQTLSYIKINSLTSVALFVFVHLSKLSISFIDSKHLQMPFNYSSLKLTFKEEIDAGNLHVKSSPHACVYVSLASNGTNELSSLQCFSALNFKLACLGKM